jgi:hypothetical protein
VDVAGSITEPDTVKLPRDTSHAQSDQLGAIFGCQHTFCKLETVGMPADRHADKWRTRLVKMTGFVIKYGKEDDLYTTHHRTYASISYEVAHEHLGCKALWRYGFSTSYGRPAANREQIRCLYMPTASASQRLSLFLIVGHFGKSRIIVINMYLDINIYLHA